MRWPDILKLVSIDSIKFLDDAKIKEDFIEQLEWISHCEIITPIEIYNLFMGNNMSINVQQLIAYLCRESQSLAKITPNIIKRLIKRLQAPDKTKFNKRAYSFIHTPVFKFQESLSSLSTSQQPYSIGTPAGQKEPTQEEILQRGQDLFLKLSDCLYESNKTLNDILYPKIFYKVIDGFEYQLIKIDALIECLENVGFMLSDLDKTSIPYFCTMAFKDTVKVKSIAKFMTEVGIHEDLPHSNRHLDYTTLGCGSVRLLNKINAYMDEHGQDSVEEFLGQENIDHYEVVSQKKTEKIQIVKNTKLRDLLWDKGLFPYGQDLDDAFCDFLVLFKV